MARNKITVIVPVYGDWSSLYECIKSLKTTLSDQHKILLSNDNGPEADAIEKHILESIKDNPNFEYHRNNKNLGFLQNCNQAVLKLDKTDNDILLLNSDTKVTKGFLEEMSSVMYSDNKIGAVSPRSNNATICTIPLSAIRQKGIAAEKSYELFEKYKEKFPRFTKVPTAHGFCMLIRREVINKYGLFDEVFGKGYGEEVDLCQRISQHGWISALSNWSYVFHLEARSFSLETKAKLLEENNKIIRSRYPDYKQSVTNYIEEALALEEKIFGKVNQPSTNRTKTKLKNLVKRNKRIYKLAQKLNKSTRSN